MNGISAILLAAGESKRMGRHVKQTLEIDGVPLVRRAAQTILRAEPVELAATLGHERAALQPLLADLPIKIVYNDRYREGQMTSVYAGMRALSQPCRGVMVCLCDQPLLDQRDLTFIADAFTRLTDRGDDVMLVPTYRGQRGNPVVIPSSMRGEILNGGDINIGCRNLMRRYPDRVAALEMPNDHAVADIDTPADYRRIVERLDAPATAKARQ